MRRFWLASMLHTERPDASPHIVKALAALVLAATLAATPALASQRPEDRDRVGRPELVAPAEGATLAESDLRFAFEPPRGWGHPQLILSRRPFDPVAWSEIPAISDLTVYDASRPILSLEDIGVTLDSDTRFWWAIAVRSETGALKVSAVVLRGHRAGFVLQPLPCPNAGALAKTD